ncbi:hypothetical protein FACS189479_04610 [Spirochaetia bacterium]|nr:hypothetical protein FACS189479_04610 [Spirochaetia bacterium]
MIHGIKYLWPVLMVIFVSCLTSEINTGSKVVTYPGPAGIAASDKYAVAVNGKPSFTYISRAKERTGNDDTASWTNFSFSGGSVTVKVTKLNGEEPSSVIVRPLDLAIVPEIKGSSAIFTISKSCKISVEFDGKLMDKCFVFADAPEINPPSPDDPGVWYFGPGIHDIGRSVSIPRDKHTVYLAGGAYVRGSFYTNLEKRDNVTITGRGILSGENLPHADLDGMIRFYDRNADPSYATGSIKIEGITMVDAHSFHIDFVSRGKNAESNPHIIDNVKMIAWAYNTDGYHLSGYNRINDLFIFNSDDALDVGQYSIGATITNCVLWQNRSGSSLLFSWVAYEDTGNTLVDNIDIIHFDENEFWDNNYVFMAQHGEAGNIRNIVINDVRIEKFGGGIKRFLGLQLKKHAWAKPNTPLGSISNIRFKNIRIDEQTSGNLIAGFDEDHTIYDIVFEDLIIDGKLITSTEQANIRMNEYVGNVEFK